MRVGPKRETERRGATDLAALGDKRASCSRLRTLTCVTQAQSDAPANLRCIV